MPESAAAAHAPFTHPAPRYAWYVVGVLTLAHVAGFVDRLILSLMITPIKRDLGLSDTQMSLLLGLAFSALYTVIGLPVGRLADRANRRNIVGAGIALWSVMTAACGLASSYGRLLVTRIGVGVGEATLVPAATSLLADYFPSETLSSAMAVLWAGVFLGSGLAYIIGGTVIGMLTDQRLMTWPVVGAVHPWQSAFFIVGLPGLFIALLTLTVREPQRRGASRAGSTGDLLLYVRRNFRSFTCTGLGFTLSSTVNFGIALWLAEFLQRTYGLSARDAGVVQGSLTMTVGVAGALGGGRLAGWFARRGFTDAPLRVGVIGALGMIVSATAFPLMPSAMLAVLWLVVVNVFAALPWGAVGASAAEIMPASMRAQGAALYFFVLNLVPQALGPAAVALITDHVFHADSALRFSLAIVNVTGMTGAIALLIYAMPAYRRTIATRGD